MAFIVTANVLQNDAAETPEPELRPNGAAYPLRMFYDQNRYIADADNCSEMLSLLINNYHESSKARQLTLRNSLAQSVAAMARATLLARNSNLIEEAKNEGKIVLVESDYHPYTRVPQPTSPDSSQTDILWLRPQNEQEFLKSLHEIGFITFGTSQETKV